MTCCELVGGLQKLEGGVAPARCAAAVLSFVCLLLGAAPSASRRTT